ncbi:LDLR chaperone boca-like [Dendronephthya gigantea]|uniref:LDLR chaperone boca-like n=1 Tax=Dendronephthya gigantea TaxID=151771 RepID=UPI00106A78CF|nr:LDLR chaperone boca-like [Dendronephthya gigantea]
MAFKRTIAVFLLFSIFYFFALGETKKKDKEKTKIGKDVLDYTESDIYRLADQWDENDEEYDPDDYDDNDPRKPPPSNAGFDPSQFNGDPMAMMKLAKKGKTVMVFVQVGEKFDKKEADKITERWHHSLFNAQFQIQRYMVSDRRAIFLLQDGSTAWDIKDFLIKQPECESVEFDNQKFPGSAAKPDGDDQKTEL